MSDFERLRAEFTKLRACEDCGWTPTEHGRIQPSHAAGGRWVCLNCHCRAQRSETKPNTVPAGR